MGAIRGILGISLPLRPPQLLDHTHKPLTMFSSTLLAVASAALASAHTVITYPGWRGDNLITNETFPYGMQWMYPCECLLDKPSALSWAFFF